MLLVVLLAESPQRHSIHWHLVESLNKNIELEISKRGPFKKNKHQQHQQQLNIKIVFGLHFGPFKYPKVSVLQLIIDV